MKIPDGTILDITEYDRAPSANNHGRQSQLQGSKRARLYMDCKDTLQRVDEDLMLQCQINDSYLYHGCISLPLVGRQLALAKKSTEYMQESTNANWLV